MRVEQVDHVNDREKLRQVWEWAKAEADSMGEEIPDREKWIERPAIPCVEYFVYLDANLAGMISLFKHPIPGRYWTLGLLTHPKAPRRRLIWLLQGFMGEAFRTFVDCLIINLPREYKKQRKLARYFGFHEVKDGQFISFGVDEYGIERSEKLVKHAIPGVVSAAN